MKDRTHLLLSHLALALAGVCLTCAELDFLPEMAAGLPLYLLLVALACRLNGRRMLPMWAANVLGLVIAAGVALWVLYNAADWPEVGPLPGERGPLRIITFLGGLSGEELVHLLHSVAPYLIPFVGPLLMALLLVRLFRASP